MDDRSVHEVGCSPSGQVLPPPLLEELERTDSYVLVVWRRLLLLVWRSRANPMGIERSRVLFDDWIAAHPGDMGFLVVIPEGRSRTPDAETLEAMARTARAPHRSCRGMATLIESEGFIAASVRAIMMRIHSIASREDPPLVFGSVVKAARWASELLDDDEITWLSLAEAVRASQKRN
jgi:hypothetical protein